MPGERAELDEAYLWECGMSDGSKIEWTDATWNPITGCSVVSAGCKHCYAMRLSGTRLRHQPMRWKKPRRICVCTHGDLFHESVPGEWIDRVFAVMALAPQHLFQVRTKRPKRMLEWFAGGARPNIGVYNAAVDILKHGGGTVDWTRMPRDMARTRSSGGAWWPLPNVWLGVSVENQAAADERIPPLLKTPAAVRFISYEPSGA